MDSPCSQLKPSGMNAHEKVQSPYLRLWWTPRGKPDQKLCFCRLALSTPDSNVSLNVGGDSSSNRIQPDQSPRIGQTNIDSLKPTLPRRQVVTIAEPDRDLSGNVHTLGCIPVYGRFPKRVLSSGGQRHRDMETGYGILKLHPIHGNLLSLLEVEVQPDALTTLTQYYDSPLRCFTFRDFQLAPTLEEYERIIGMPLAKSPPYLFKGKNPSWASMAKLLGISKSEVWREKRNRNGLEGIPRASLEGRLD
ncbi:hypothetical protein CR513_44283, partial [Mucuna pruriens]